MHTSFLSVSAAEPSHVDKRENRKNHQPMSNEAHIQETEFILPHRYRNQFDIFRIHGNDENPPFRSSFLHMIQSFDIVFFKNLAKKSISYF